MATDANELNRWVTRFQRKLDSIPLAKVDREDMEEMLAIVVNLTQRQLVETQPEVAQRTTTRAKKDGGES